MTDLHDVIDQDTRTVLQSYGFDPDQFSTLQGAVRDGDLSAESNVIVGDIQPPAPDDIVPLPEPGDDAFEAASAAGRAALAEGAFASVVLNGGMATRFGGVVKGIVEAVDGQSFLEIKLAQAAAVTREVGADLPTAVMTSYATDAATREFLQSRGQADPLYFNQYVSLRLEPDGSLFRDGQGKPSLYGPGHGDFLLAFRRSGTLAALLARGVRYVMVSNVDNLPARPDPVVIGSHILAGRPMTAEVVTNSGDVGGAPARVNGELLIVESMRFPASFDHRQLPVTNVNTVTFDLESLDRDFDLTWLYVQKKVEGRVAVQLERLYHEASAFLATTYLKVPATGPRGRFLPIKAPQDLTAAQPVLRQVLDRPPLR